MSIDTKYLGEWTYFDGTDAPAGDPDFVLTHLADLHGQLGSSQQVYYDNPRARPPIEFEGEDEVIRPVRGLPTHVSKLDALRSEYDTLLAMSGDTFHGTAETTYTNGQIMIEPINAHVQPDVYVPGNWDFGHEGAADGSALELFDALDAPTLATNLTDASGSQLYDGYRLVEVGGVTIGIVGMTNPYIDRMAPAFHEGKYAFGKAPSLLDETARAAREAGASFVVAVTEIGLPWVVQAAKDFESVDVSLSAHTHEYTYEPIVIGSTETVVVESGMSEALGRIDVRFDGGRPAFRHVLYTFVDGHEYTPAPDTATEVTVEELRAPFFESNPGFQRGAGTLDRPLSTVVGETKSPLSRQSFLESPWNTLFNDALVEYFDADLAISHGNRYGQAIPAGEITLEDIYTFFPVTAPVAAGDAWGQQLWNHVETSLIDNFTPHVYDQEDGRMRAFSGNVELLIDPTAKRGRRLVSFLIDGAPIDPDETYRVATFRRPGAAKRDLGGCNFPFRNVSVEDAIPAAVLVEFLEANSPVEYELTGRVDTPPSGGWVQNTPAEGPYPFIQPGVDYTGGQTYVETAMVPRRYDHPKPGPAPGAEDR
ncbi:bifunctional metallophosphatase/5'-nucleotidase [Halodesulfurarchaeum formicicum]|uniref:5'-nucleotidase n=1 Tax=Halodesulfurarchaeum formicicum TaxID=1873524 RepID=A0A1J1ABM0_9EURY|nr:bifunctional metallophosphatase/5'-nucleotidase [Halodesulfurarchaeum formicicum]APE95192.1 5'-nucleotidase [Halodesulfurarchaeum formicicum]